MKAPQQTEGRTDQMLGAMGDILTSLALPSQPWVRFEGTRQVGGGTLLEEKRQSLACNI